MIKSESIKLVVRVVNKAAYGITKEVTLVKNYGIIEYTNVITSEEYLFSHDHHHHPHLRRIEMSKFLNPDLGSLRNFKKEIGSTDSEILNACNWYKMIFLIPNNHFNNNLICQLLAHSN
ncbi:6431_t:CDS:2 [Funneliformis mosseae]|uniref:6431_t:CDS:1 n=1 Tax=Funneliformis mosseae TaxID=27381 RepID=A0A9N8ZMA2_FUNMO|nr:6431_t:CDS:2 [Funneliformis mosseae]